MIDSSARAARFCARLLLITLCSTGGTLAASRWERLGPSIGAMEVVAFAPGGGTHAVAAGRGGVYRSTDGGASWTLISDPSPNGFTAVVYDPSDAQRVFLAASTGEPSAGVFVSEDGGQTYTQRKTGFDTVGESYAASLAVSHDGSRIYAGGGNRGVFVSTDHGATWTVGNTGLPTAFGRYESVTALTVHPGNPSVVHAAVFGNGIYKSVDGGATWTPSNAGLPSVHIGALVVDPNDGLKLLTTSGGSLFKTIDGGTNWTPTGYSGPVLSILSFDPDSSQRVFGATWDGEIYRSTDSGVNFWPIVTGLTTGWVNQVTAAGGGSTRVLAVGRQGTSVSADQGSTWAEPSGLFNGNLVALLQHPTDASLIYAATAGGFFRSTDGGESFHRHGTGLVGEVNLVVMHPSDPNTLYAGMLNDNLSGDNTLFRSVDGGATWNPLVSAALTDREVAAFAIAPSNPSVMYLTGTRVVGITVSRSTLRSIDGGLSWTSIDNGLPVYPASFEPKALVVSHTDPNIVVLGSYDGGYRTTDGGATWAEIAALQDGDHNMQFVTVEMLARDPHTPGTLYAGGQGNYGLKRSTDDGATWSGSLFSGGSVFALAVHPENPQRLLAGILGDGLRESTNRGTSWTQLEDPDAAPNAFLTAQPVLYDHGGARLLAGIADRGLQAYSIASDLAIDVTTGTTGTVILGNTVTATALVMNDGPDAALDATVTVSFDGQFTDHSITLGGIACPVTGSVATCAGIELESSGSRTLQVLATTAQTGARGFTLTVTSSNADPDTSDDSVTRGFTVVGQADLSVGLTVPATRPLTGATARVTATVANAGPHTATGLELDLGLVEGASFVAASGATCVQTGTALACTSTDLAAGGTRAIDLDVQFTTPGANAISAAVDAVEQDPDSGDDTAGASVAVRGRADLRMAFAAPSPAEITTGQRTTYDSVVTNLGPDTATDVAINYVVPSGASSVSATGATCQASGVTVGCTVASLGSGASVAIPVAMNLSTNGTMTLSGSVSASEADADTGNNADSSSVGVSRPTTGADLTVAVTGGAASLQVNKTTTYSFSVTNTGPQASTGGSFTFTVPALLTGSSIKADKPVKCTKGAVMRCTLSAMTVGQTVRGTIKLKAKKTPGTATMTATVTGSPADFDTSNNTATRSLTITPKP